MPAAKTHIARATALALAIGVNALFVLLCLFSRAKATPEPVTTSMVWIVAALEQLRPPPRRSVPVRAARAGAHTQTSMVAPATDPLEAAPEPAREPAATDGPRIDWQAEVEKAAQSLLRNGEQRQPEHSPDQNPQIQVRPDSFWIPPVKGTTEQLPGGGQRVWTSDLCYLESNPLVLDPLKGGFSMQSRTVCKVRSLSERQSEARAEAIADAIRRKRAVP